MRLMVVGMCCMSFAVLAAVSILMPCMYDVYIHLCVDMSVRFYRYFFFWLVVCKSLAFCILQFRLLIIIITTTIIALLRFYFVFRSFVHSSWLTTTFCHWCCCLICRHEYCLQHPSAWLNAFHGIRAFSFGMFSGAFDDGCIHRHIHHII